MAELNGPASDVPAPGAAHVLGVSSGPQPEPSASAVDVPVVLAAFAAAGARPTAITVDEVSAGLLATIGVVEPDLPEALRGATLDIPAACGPALPVLSMWPLESVSSAAVGTSGSAVGRSSGIDEWRLRVESAAYSLHRTTGVDLTLCGIGCSAGRSASLMLAAECGVPVLALLDEDVTLDGTVLAVLDCAVAVWAPTATAAAAWSSAVPDVAPRVVVVDRADADALAAAASSTLDDLAALADRLVG